MTSKVPCKRCGTMILPETAQRTRGKCMPCSRRPWWAFIPEHLKRRDERKAALAASSFPCGAVIQWAAYAFRDSAALEGVLEDLENASDKPSVIHKLSRAGKVALVDWRSPPEEIVDALRNLTVSRELRVDWTTIKHECERLDPSPAKTVLPFISSSLKNQDWCLMDLCTDSDGYAVFPAKCDDTGEIKKLANRTKVLRCKVF